MQKTESILSSKKGSKLHSWYNIPSKYSKKKKRMIILHVEFLLHVVVLLFIVLFMTYDKILWRAYSRPSLASQPLRCLV